MANKPPLLPDDSDEETCIIRSPVAIRIGTTYRPYPDQTREGLIRGLNHSEKF
jgi:hypothetical protein